MTLDAQCPSCGTSFAVETGEVDKIVPCPSCQADVRLSPPVAEAIPVTKPLVFDDAFEDIDVPASKRPMPTLKQQRRLIGALGPVGLAYLSFLVVPIGFFGLSCLIWLKSNLGPDAPFDVTLADAGTVVRVLLAWNVVSMILFAVGAWWCVTAMRPLDLAREPNHAFVGAIIAAVAAFIAFVGSMGELFIGAQLVIVGRIIFLLLRLYAILELMRFMQLLGRRLVERRITDRFVGFFEFYYVCVVIYVTLEVVTSCFLDVPARLPGGSTMGLVMDALAFLLSLVFFLRCYVLIRSARKTLAERVAVTAGEDR